MAAVSKSFYDTPNRRGLVIGVLPCDESLEKPKDGYPTAEDAHPTPRDAHPTPKEGYPTPKDAYPTPKDGYPTPMDGYPNQWVEIPVLTHLPLSGERGTEPMSRWYSRSRAIGGGPRSFCWRW